MWVQVCKVGTGFEPLASISSSVLYPVLILELSLHFDLSYTLVRFHVCVITLLKYAHRDTFQHLPKCSKQPLWQLPQQVFLGPRTHKVK